MSQKPLNKLKQNLLTAKLEAYGLKETFWEICIAKYLAKKKRRVKST